MFGVEFHAIRWGLWTNRFVRERYANHLNPSRTLNGFWSSWISIWKSPTNVYRVYHLLSVRRYFKSLSKCIAAAVMVLYVPLVALYLDIDVPIVFILIWINFDTVPRTNTFRRRRFTLKYRLNPTNTIWNLTENVNLLERMKLADKNEWVKLECHRQSCSRQENWRRIVWKDARAWRGKVIPTSEEWGTDARRIQPQFQVAHWALTLTEASQLWFWSYEGFGSHLDEGITRWFRVNGCKFEKYSNAFGILKKITTSTCNVSFNWIFGKIYACHFTAVFIPHFPRVNIEIKFNSVSSSLFLISYLRNCACLPSIGIRRQVCRWRFQNDSWNVTLLSSFLSSYETRAFSAKRWIHHLEINK